MERKLSTVFALDVVGYSKLMADDEARTLSNLKMRRDFIDSQSKNLAAVYLIPLVIALWRSSVAP